MRVFTEDKLRKRISVLRIGKAMNQLKDSGLIELTKCELLLENFWSMQDLKFAQKIDNEIEMSVNELRYYTNEDVFNGNLKENVYKFYTKELYTIEKSIEKLRNK